MCGYPFTHLLLLSICLHNQKYSSSPKDSLLLLDFLLEDFLLEDFLLDFFEVLPVVVVLLGITGAGSVMVTAVVVLQPPEEMVIVISPEERAVINPFLLIVATALSEDEYVIFSSENSSGLSVGSSCRVSPVVRL